MLRLLDTDIFIDLHRRYSPAVQWLAALPEPPGVPGFALLELMVGARNQREMDILLREMAAFRVYWPTAADCARAVTTYARARLRSGLSVMDLMIGECAVGSGATLCSFDRDMQIIPGLVTEQPYPRP